MRAVPFLLLFASSLHAAPTDAELLKYVKERAKMERVTPKPVDMAAAVLARCNIDAVLKGQASKPANPHYAATFHVYANDAAVLPLFDPWGKSPEGSVVLKEKFSRENGKTELFTGMIKRELGYFPECGDWEFFTVDGAASKIVERGKMERCATCHENAEMKDHLSKIYIKPAQLSGGRIVLHSSKSTAHGEKLHYEEIEAKNTLGFWVNATDWASWDFEVNRPGTYAIHVWQGCGPGSGDSEVEVKCAGQNSRFKVEETKGFQDFKEREIGKVTFGKAGPQTLEVHAISKPGLAVMDLRQVVLVPVKE